jgi:hypothetical protein
MTKSELRHKLITDFFSACEDSIEEGVKFIAKNIFMEPSPPPNYIKHGDENILQAVGRKYAELDDFAIAVGNHLKGLGSDATPLNVTTAERVAEIMALKPDLGKTLYEVFKNAGHDYVIPLLRTPEYQSLKTAERKPQAA